MKVENFLGYGTILAHFIKNYKNYYFRRIIEINSSWIIEANSSWIMEPNSSHMIDENSKPSLKNLKYISLFGHLGKITKNRDSNILFYYISTASDIKLSFETTIIKSSVRDEHQNRTKEKPVLTLIQWLFLYLFWLPEFLMSSIVFRTNN